MMTEIQQKQTTTDYNDEFEAYLKKQCLKTTFNGLEVDSFTWYRRMLGTKQFLTKKKNKKEGGQNKFYPPSFLKLKYYKL